MKIPRRLLFFVGFFGLGLAPWPALAQSGITASSTSLDFGGVGVDTFSQPQALTLTHSEAGDGEIGTVSLAGEEPQQFLIVTDACSTAVLGVGESCQIEVLYGPRFDLPGGVGDTSALLLVPFSSSPSLSVELRGSGLLPKIASSVTSIDFQDLTAGKISDPSEVVLSNVGEADLDIRLVAVTGTNTTSFNIQVDNCSFQTLEPGGLCSVEIAFHPLVIGDLASTLTVSSGDPVTPFLSVALFGQGKGSGGCSLGASGGGLSGHSGIWKRLASNFIHF